MDVPCLQIEFLSILSSWGRTCRCTKARWCPPWNLTRHAWLLYTSEPTCCRCGCHGLWCSWCPWRHDEGSRRRWNLRRRRRTRPLGVAAHRTGWGWSLGFGDWKFWGDLVVPGSILGRLLCDLARERSISGAGGTIWREGRVDLQREGAGTRGGARDRRRRLLRLRRAGSGRFVLGSDDSTGRVVERPLRSLPSFLFLPTRTFLTCTRIPRTYVAP